MRRAVEIAGRRLSLANLEKDLYPAHGFTKADIFDYYRRIAPFILPHLRGRALTLKRYPDGVGEPFFFEKRCPAHRPAWVKTARIPRHDGEMMRVCLVDDLATLVWVGNLASLELHVPLARAATPATPDAVVFDLDPGDPAGIVDCARVALILRELFAPLRLASFVKTSGQKGLHVYVPLNRREATFGETKRFAKAVAEVLERNEPDRVTAKMARALRTGKVFINWEQNDAAKTMVCVYSLRAREKPFVSFPLAWEELETLARQGDPEGFQRLPPCRCPEPRGERGRPLRRGAHEAAEAPLPVGAAGRASRHGETGGPLAVPGARCGPGIGDCVGIRAGAGMTSIRDLPLSGI